MGFIATNDHVFTLCNFVMYEQYYRNACNPFLYRAEFRHVWMNHALFFFVMQIITDRSISSLCGGKGGGTPWSYLIKFCLSKSRFEGGGPGPIWSSSVHPSPVWWARGTPWLKWRGTPWLCPCLGGYPLPPLLWLRSGLYTRSRCIDLQPWGRQVKEVVDLCLLRKWRYFLDGW